MNTSTNFFELLNGMSFSMPIQWAALVLGVLALCLIWGRYKLGVLAAFGSLMYWGYKADFLGMVQYMHHNMIAMLGGIFVALSMSFLILMTLFEESR